jgi:hypothetical protein
MQKEEFISSQLDIPYRAYSVSALAFIEMVQAFLKKGYELSLSYNNLKEMFGQVVIEPTQTYCSLTHSSNFQLGVVEEIYRFLKEKES